MTAAGTERQENGARSLRFSVLCEDGLVAAWEADAVKALLEKRSASLVAILCVARSPRRSAERFCDGVAERSGAAAMRRRAAAQVFPGTPLRPVPRSDGDAGEFEGGLDFVLDFANVESAQSTFPTTHGVWRFVVERGAPAARGVVGSLARGRAGVEALLVARDGQRTRVLRRGFVGSARHSIRRALDAVLGELTAWPALAANDPGGGSRDDGADTAAASPPQLFSTAFGLAWNVGLRKVERIANLFVDPCWNIGVIDMPIDALLRQTTLPSVAWHPDLPSSHYLADPWGVVVDGDGITVLCESYDFATRLGSICWTRFDGSSWSPILPAMKIACHASYPSLVEDGGSLYCIPETQAAGEVALYRSVRFPDEWEKECVLLKGVHGVDSTIVRHEGRYWLFCTDSQDRGMQNLRIYYAPALRGPWSAHARNPVKVDMRSARPAGTPFVHDGALYRPAQDCSESYGGRVVMNRVIRLSPEEFEEEAAAAIGPQRGGKYSRGFHTVCSVGNRVLVDGRGIALTFGGLRSRLDSLWQKVRGT